MKKEIIILGDIEMGAGTLTDDFISDEALSTLIFSLCKRNHSVDLILNGDTFDFLKCPYVRNGKKKYPRHITAHISLAKLDLIHKAHKKVFDALGRFVSKTKNSIYFIYGNHDPDLYFKEVQHKIRQLLKSKRNVFFSLLYNKHKVYAEHGHRYDLVYNSNGPKPFMEVGRRKILNLPWMSLILMNRCMDIKERAPFMERIKPYSVIFKIRGDVVRKFQFRYFKYLFLNLLYYPLRYRRDPTYFFPVRFVSSAWNALKLSKWRFEEVFEVKVLRVFKKKRRDIIKKNKIIVLSHLHDFKMENKKSIIIHPDTWRDEYTINPKTGTLTPKKKRFVKILVDDNNELKHSVEVVPIKRSAFSFRRVLKDEVGAVHWAAKEENFIVTV